VQVLVASRELNPGIVVKSGDLRWQAWPKASLAPSYMSQPALPKALDQAMGSTVRAHLDQGEPVTSSKLIKADGSGLLAAMLTPGMRAISTKIDENTAAGGFILPGDRVDVVMTRKRDGKSGYESETVLTNVRVLAIGDAIEGATSDKRLSGKTATLELSSSQAEKLALANAMGKLTLVLRSTAKAEGVTAAIDPPQEEPKTTSGPVSVLRYGRVMTVQTGEAAAGGTQ
jgi:pilus assembly protein CpaB